MRREPLKTKAAQHQDVDDGRSSIAPVKGWNARDPEALMKEGYAKYLENMEPTGSAVNLRPGVTYHKTTFTNPVKSLMAYHSAAGVGALFAATNSGIYDATAAGIVGSSLASLTEGWCSHVNYRTSGASYLFVANGVDSIRRYDGTSWVEGFNYSINGGGTLNGTDVINFCVHQRRLWMIKKDSADAYYFDVNAASGNVTLFPLGGYLNKGGYLIAAYTWTIDGGAGPEDLIVFVSSKGQLVVYAGTDPATIPGSWALRGVYNMPSALGRRCGYKLGGDLLLLTEGGVFSMTDLASGKPLTQDLAISDLIRPEMARSTQLYGVNKGWQLAGLLSRNLLFVNVPTTEASAAYQYGMNSTSKGWWKNVGWNALCFEEFNNELYVGIANSVGKAWSGVLDYSTNVTGYARGHYDYFGERTREKRWQLFRPVVRISGSIALNMGLDVDFSSSSDFGSPVFGTGGGSVWDTSLWDTATFASEDAPRLEWKTPGAKPGYCAAVRLRVVSNGGTFSWSATDQIFERGARVVA